MTTSAAMGGWAFPSKVLRWRSSVQVPVKGGMVLFWAGARVVSARRKRARCFMAEVYFNVQRKLEVDEREWMLKTSERTALFGMDKAELTSVMAGFGQKAYRAQQVFDALYKQRVAGLDEVTTLPLELRERMVAEGFGVGLPEIVQAAKSVDGTERYLMRMVGGETVETVWMPDGDGGERGDGGEAG